MANEGQTRPRGTLAAEKNAEAPARGGVTAPTSWVTARYQDGVLTLSVGGSATYGNGLTAGATRGVGRAYPALERAMASVLKRFGPRIEAEAMTAAYQARAAALLRGENLFDDDDDDDAEED
jgi:hypothetical protein